MGRRRPCNSDLLLGYGSWGAHAVKRAARLTALLFPDCCQSSAQRWLWRSWRDVLLEFVDADGRSLLKQSMRSGVHEGNPGPCAFLHDYGISDARTLSVGYGSFTVVLQVLRRSARSAQASTTVGRRRATSSACSCPLRRAQVRHNNRRQDASNRWIGSPCWAVLRAQGAARHHRGCTVRLDAITVASVLWFPWNLCELQCAVDDRTR